MKYYEIHVDGVMQLVGTQAEVKALKQPIVEHHIPDDKDSRMEYVNKLLRAPVREPVPEQTAKSQPDVPEREQVDPARRNSAAVILAEIDAPKGVDPNKIVEIIMTSKGYVLARFAQAVAVAFERLKA
jgi:hypothetical protein